MARIRTFFRDMTDLQLVTIFLAEGTILAAFLFAIVLAA